MREASSQSQWLSSSFSSACYASQLLSVQLPDVPWQALMRLRWGPCQPRTSPTCRTCCGTATTCCHCRNCWMMRTPRGQLQTGCLSSHWSHTSRDVWRERPRCAVASPRRPSAFPTFPSCVPHCEPGMASSNLTPVDARPPTCIVSRVNDMMLVSQPSACRPRMLHPQLCKHSIRGVIVLLPRSWSLQR